MFLCSFIYAGVYSGSILLSPFGNYVDIIQKIVTSTYEHSHYPSNSLVCNGCWKGVVYRFFFYRKRVTIGKIIVDRFWKVSGVLIPQKKGCTLGQPSWPFGAVNMLNFVEEFACDNIFSYFLRPFENVFLWNPYGNFSHYPYQFYFLGSLAVFFQSFMRPLPWFLLSRTLKRLTLFDPHFRSIL